MSNAKDRLAKILAARRAQNGTVTQPTSNTDSEGSSRTDRETSGGEGSTGTPTTNGDTVHTSTTNNDIPVRSEPEPSPEVQAKPEEVAKEVTKVVVPGTPDTHPLALKLWELEEALDKQMPDRVHILKHIHDSLKADPTVVTLLTDEAIGLIVKGLTDHTNTTIVAAPKKATTKRSQPLSLDLLD